MEMRLEKSVASYIYEISHLSNQHRSTNENIYWKLSLWRCILLGDHFQIIETQLSSFVFCLNIPLVLLSMIGKKHSSRTSNDLSLFSYTSSYSAKK